MLAAVLTATAQQAPQKIYIESFTADPLDQAAKNHPKKDVNGDLYALIKVRPASPKFIFKFGLMKCLVDEASHPGETWLYVQKNARKISILRDGFEPVSYVDLGITLDAGATYVLQLSYTEPTVAIEKQFLSFKVSPAEARATVKVRKTGAETYELWGQTDAQGTLSRFLECGRYEYQIVAENYLPTDGIALLNDPNGTLEEPVTLTPNFGYLQIDDAYGIAGAQIFVNDRLIGTIPYDKKDPWQAGTYNLSITNGDLYKTYSSTFTITNGQTTRLQPKLESNAADTRLVVNADAEIYVDKVLKGTREWKGPLRAGSYEVECRMDRHTSTFKTVVVQADVPQTVLLDAPKARTGALAVSTSPLGATIILDGQKNGHTPTVLKDLLIGEHTVELSLPNHKVESCTVEVREGQTVELNKTLSTMALLTISSDPAGARLSLDGRSVGTTPYTAEMASGDYRIRLEKSGFKTLEETAHLDASHPSVSFSLKRQMVQPTTLYVQPTFAAGSLMAFGGALGGYIANVNIEAFYLMGMGESETIYWNYTGSTSQMPQSEVLSPASYMGGKLGYGITVGRVLRVTPQAGAGVLNIKGDVSAAHAVTASLGARVELIFAHHFGISLAPEYGFAVKKSETFEQLSAVSQTVSGWAGGFQARLGVFFCL